jgi:hypothetical protein
MGAVHFCTVSLRRLAGSHLSCIFCSASFQLGVPHPCVLGKGGNPRPSTYSREKYKSESKTLGARTPSSGEAQSTCLPPFAKGAKDGAPSIGRRLLQLNRYDKVGHPPYFLSGGAANIFQSRTRFDFPTAARISLRPYHEHRVGPREVAILDRDALLKP